MKDKREKLAALCHDQWAGWMGYLISKSERVDGRIIIPAWAVKRWDRQRTTPYEKLPESEKASDRKEADRFLQLLKEK